VAPGADHHQVAYSVKNTVMPEAMIGNTLIAGSNSYAVHDYGIPDGSVVQPLHGQAFAATHAHPSFWR
jgi:hypothetical protein